VNGQSGYILPIDKKNQTPSGTINNQRPLIQQNSTLKTNENKPVGVKVWQIDSETMPCDEGNNNRCLLVKKHGEKEFEIFYGNIEGFNHENGYNYIIWVIDQSNSLQSDSLFESYKLVKVVSKTKSDNNITTSSTIKSHDNDDIIFEIDYETFPCEPEINRSCLMVKKIGDKEYEIFYSTIENFEYEPGFRYQISVNRDEYGNYKLIKINSKQFIKQVSTKFITEAQPNSGTKIDLIISSSGKKIGQTNIQTSSDLDRKWFLRKLKENDTTVILTDDNNLWIELDTFKDKCSGQSICNNFESVVMSDQVTSFQMFKLTPGNKICANIKIEELFFNLLQDVNRFEIKDNNLILSKQWVYKLVFTSDPEKK
jgi:hypothetical protein